MVNGYYYELEETEKQDIFILDRKDVTFLVRDNQELIKETFNVKIKPLFEGYYVKVTSNKTGASTGEFCERFPNYTARKLRKALIKESKRKERTEKEYTL